MVKYKAEETPIGNEDDDYDFETVQYNWISRLKSQGRSFAKKGSVKIIK